MKNYILKKTKNYNSVIDAGIYPVTIKNVDVIDNSNDTSKEFDEAKITFEFQDGGTVKSTFKVEIREYSRFDMLIKSALGEFNDSINLFDIVGCQIEIEITHNIVNNKTYPNVYKVFRYGTNTNAETEEYIDEESVEDFEEELEIEDYNEDLELDEDFELNEELDFEEDVDEPEEVPPPKKKKRKSLYI